jgi:hypothetical protein
MADTSGKQYTIGKGRVFFDQFKPGTKLTTGERYLGNTPAFTQSISQDSLDHIDADQGLNIKDESIVIKNDLTGSFETDNISVDNIAMFFGGDSSPLTVAAATAVVDANVTVMRGRTYQLGTDEATPMGTKKVTNVVVNKVTAPVPPATTPTLTPVTLTGNFEVDLEKARVYIEVDAPDVADGDVLQFTYDQEAYSREIVIAKGQQVSGALRFLADNPHGTNRDYFYPYVKITSNGDYALKGDDWLKMSFNFEVLKKDAATERAYIDGVAAA